MPPTTGTPRAVQASARPVTARSSCQATAGFSGLPKLRQLVRPSGSAPTQARFWAHSSTASTAPACGSQATRRPLPSIETAIARPDSGSIRTAASAASGRRTVREPTTESYCSKAQRFEAMLGEASRATRTAEGSAGSAERPACSATRSPSIVLVAVEPAPGLFRLEVVQRALVHQRRHRDVSDLLAVVEHPHRAGVGDLADHGGPRLPLLAQRQHRVDPAGLDDRQHPLLRLGDHDLEGLHVGLAQRHPADVDVDPDAALRGHLARRRGEPGGAEVLERDQQPAASSSRRALEQLRLLERVADLDGRALGVVAGLELGRGEHRGAADAVAPGRGADQDQHVSGPRGGRADHLARSSPARRTSR